MSVARHLKQTATYWAPLGTDRFNKRTYATPTQIPVRWEDVNELFTDNKGREQVAKSRIFTLVALEEEGYLFLGTSAAADPTVVRNANPIRSLRQQPDLRSLQQLYSAML